jgi:hypothetical protein
MAKTNACVGAAIALLATAVPMAAHADPPAEATPPRVRIKRPADAAAVTKAVRGAIRRLERDACLRIFSEFADMAGRPLQAGLDALGLTAPAYLQIVGFYDGSAQRRCERSTIQAFTTPGHRVVFVCPRFTRMQLGEPAAAEMVVLHEVLHTLGLGENPPTSTEITRRVTARCGRERP